MNVRSVRDASNRQDRHVLTGPGRAFVLGIDRSPLAVHIFSTTLESIRTETTGGLGNVCAVAGDEMGNTWIGTE